MSGTARIGQLGWRATRVVATRPETDSARTLVLDVAHWPGHSPGQRLDLRLIADDRPGGVRSYSIASSPGLSHVELTVQRAPDDEVSTYLVDGIGAGDQCEVRGPLGDDFVWDPGNPAPVALAAGGSGIVPLMAMIRTRARMGRRIPFRLLYACRGPAEVIYASELERHSAPGTGLDVTYAYSRRVPPEWPRRPGRVDQATVTGSLWPPEVEPICFVCGPTGFVEHVADLLLQGGHPSGRINTEFYGPRRD